jgi:hypothetical protein
LITLAAPGLSVVGQQDQSWPSIARGSAMESASHLDVMRVDELIDAELYARGIELLERIVAMRRC